jgi:hypothetical protein
MKVLKKSSIGRTLDKAATAGSCICIGACISALLFPIGDPVTSLHLASASTIFSTLAAGATAYFYESNLSSQ